MLKPVTHEAELSLVEKFACPFCRAEFYVRYALITLSPSLPGELVNFRLSPPKKVGCTNENCTMIDENGETVKTVLNMMKAVPNTSFHYGFQCEGCGKENLDTKVTPPKEVVCDGCGLPHQAVYLPYMKAYLSECKKLIK